MVVPTNLAFTKSYRIRMFKILPQNKDYLKIHDTLISKFLNKS
ncbi:hypothetical protein LEP1GSC082_1131 [Leptospira kirschneri str. H2]|nr:hypothetical protein LEP1GSC082_1131 [Leptospira kirschneri str. H2]